MIRYQPVRVARLYGTDNDSFYQNESLTAIHQQCTLLLRFTCDSLQCVYVFIRKPIFEYVERI